MESFQLLKYEYVELYKLLKIMSWVGSGGEAKQLIDQGYVKVNGEVENQRRKKLRVGDQVEFADKKLIIDARQ